MTSYRIILLVVLVTGLMTPAVSYGDDADETKLKQAQAHFKQGKAFLDAGVFDEAIKEFQSSYKLAAIPELQFDIGEAYRLKGDSKSAVAAYRAYLSIVSEGELADTARMQVALLTKQLSETNKSATDQKVVEDKVKVSTTAQQDHQALRARRAHGRSVGRKFIWVGLVGSAVLTISLYAGLSEQLILVPEIGAVVVGFGYGIPKRLANSDPGEFKVTPVATGSVKGLMFSRSF